MLAGCLINGKYRGEELHWLASPFTMCYWPQNVNVRDSQRVKSGSFLYGLEKYILPPNFEAGSKPKTAHRIFRLDGRGITVFIRHLLYHLCKHFGRNGFIRLFPHFSNLYKFKIFALFSLKQYVNYSVI